MEVVHETLTPRGLPNCTCSEEHDDVSTFNMILIVTILPFLSLIGSTCNYINWKVYMYLPRTSANRYLAALSVSDLGVCIFGLGMICADSFRGLSTVLDQILVFVLPYIVPFGLFFQMLSVYITVFASIDCLINISRYHILHKHRYWYCTVETANKILLTTVVFCVMYNFIAFWELKTIRCYNVDTRTTLYELCPTDLRMNETYKAVYKGFMYTTVMVVAPLAFLISLTTAIIMAVRQNAKKDNPTIEPSLVELNSIQYTINPIEHTNQGHFKLQSASKRETLQVDVKGMEYTSESSDRNNHNLDSVIEEEEESGGSSCVMIAVVALFLGCNVISLMSNVTELLGDMVPRELHMATIDVGNFLVVFNATANFFVYISASHSFRIAIPIVILRKKRWYNRSQVNSDTVDAV